MSPVSRIPRRVRQRRLATGAALGLALFAAFQAMWIVVPAPTIPLIRTAISASEHSPVPAAVAVAAVAVGAWTLRLGGRATGWTAIALSMAALAVSLHPIASGVAAAKRHGVAVRAGEYLASMPGTPKRVDPVGAVQPDIVYAETGRTPLRLNAWRPRGTPRGAVVAVHGGSWTGGDRYDLGRWMRHITRQGLVGFSVDYRLATPTTPTWRAAVGDVKCAVGWAKRQAAHYGYAPDDVSLFGKSAGGHLALLAAYAPAHPALPPTCDAGDTSVRSVSAIYPATDLPGLAASASRWDHPTLSGVGADQMDEFMGGGVRAHPGRYALVSPLRRVTAAAPPTYLAHGGRDQVIDPDQSRALAHHLERAGVAHELVEIGYANHGFDSNWSGLATQVTRETNAAFLDRHASGGGHRA